MTKMFSRRLVQFSMMTVSPLAMLAAATPAMAQAQARQFDIPAQSLSSAILEFSRQSDVMVVVSPDLTAGKQSKALKGSMPVNEAIGQLLRGSHLRAVPNSAGGYRIERSGPVVAATQVTSPSAGEALAGSAAANSESAQDIIVTGTNIRGADAGATPVLVIGRQEIEATGLDTVPQLLQRLPQNFARASQSSIRVPGSSDSGEQGTGIDLRGIGEGTTLVLIDGRRTALGFGGAAADVSALPLSAIDRVEILKSGASAIYGADAVGGVINFILRSDYNGAETRVRGSSSPGGYNDYDLSQLLGRSWNTGNVLVSVSYHHQDLLRADERDFVPANSLVQSLAPQDSNLSVSLSGRQKLTDQLSLFADGIYTKRDSFNLSSSVGPQDNDASTRIRNPQLQSTIGADYDLGHWRIEASGSYARDNLNGTIKGQAYADPSYDGSFNYHQLFQIYSGELKVDGPLISLPGGTARLAVGTDWRRETFAYGAFTGSGVSLQDAGGAQDIFSTFAEANVPIFGAPNAQFLLRRLEVTVAGRYDRYTSFGSSVNPEVGILWSPARAVTIRASYGTSYRAPRLSDQSVANNYSYAFYGPDPLSSSGTSHILQIGGTDNSSLGPEKSKNFYAEIEFGSKSRFGFNASLGYYRISFKGQIATPPDYLTLLQNPTAYGSLIVRNPTAAQVNAGVAAGTPGQGFFAYNPDFSVDGSFDPATVNLLVDARRRNLSQSLTDGLDFSASYAMPFASGKFDIGLNGVYILRRTQQITSASVPFETVNTIYNPPHLRTRASLGWSNATILANLFVNHTSRYDDTRITPTGNIAASTTLDANLSYTLSKSGGPLSGLVISLSGQNIFNTSPPRVAVMDPNSDLGFDPTNAQPIGRSVALQLVKKW
ncbi:MAG: TonB-dependent receptor [Bradyrhizobium sp.]|nr:TonB-dependent receptor [Bradyrhizobium sp.]